MPCRKTNGTSMSCSSLFFMKRLPIKSKENKGSEKMFYMKKVSQKAKLKFLTPRTTQNRSHKSVFAFYRNNENSMVSGEVRNNRTQNQC